MGSYWLSWSQSSLRKFYSRNHDLVNHSEISVTNEHRYVPLVVNTSRSFPHSYLITGFGTRVKRQVPLMKQELLVLPKHLSSPKVFSGVPVARSFVFCVATLVFCRLFVCPFYFVLSVAQFTDSDYPFGIFKLFLAQLIQHWLTTREVAGFESHQRHCIFRDEACSTVTLAPN